MTHQLELTDLKIAWCTRMAERVIETMRGREFTSDDLHPLLEKPAHDNWFGVLMAKLRCTGRIERVGYRNSTRPERNRAAVSVWKLKE